MSPHTKARRKSAENARGIWRGLISAAALLVIAGCAGEVALNKGIDPAKIESRAQSLNVSGMTREQIMAQLGKPWISDEARRVDVFRVSEKQHRMLIVFAPYPVPFPSFGQRFSGYSLLSYGADGRVEAADSAFAVAELGNTNVSAMGNKALAIAGDYQFIHPQNGADHTTLSVAHDRYVADRANDADAANVCTVIAVCPEGAAGTNDKSGAYGTYRACWSKISVDGKPSGYLAVGSVWAETASQAVRSTADPRVDAYTHCYGDGSYCESRQFQSAPLSLVPGAHQLKFTERLVKGEFNGQLQCKAGELWYAVISGETVMGRWMQSGKPHVVFTRELPPGRPAPRVLLNFGGKWLGGHAAAIDY